MKFFFENKLAILAVVSLTLGISGIYTAWLAKYEPTPKVDYIPYAIKMDGTKVDMPQMRDQLNAQREAEREAPLLLGGLGLTAGLYVARSRSYGWLAVLISLVSMSMGILLKFSLW